MTMEKNCNTCGNDCDCTHCGSCNGGVLELTPLEYQILLCFGEVPFYPAAFPEEDIPPFCLEFPVEADRTAVSAALWGLWQKRLISMDRKIPLQGFDYRAYDEYVENSRHGSLALTLLGQQALEFLELRGF